MLLQLFEFIFGKLIGTLPPEKKDKAVEVFGELLGILAYNASKGATEGLKNG